MNEMVKIGIFGGAALVIFLILWQKGQLAQIRDYILETREELRKCSWPSWEELKGSTVVVAISLAILGSFTMAVDFVFYHLLRLLT
jgi:preprotein translocase subunit SecE